MKDLLRITKFTLKRVVPLRIGRDDEVLLNTDDSAPTTVMAILNVTPDSFSDGGRFLERDKAIIQVEGFVDVAKRKGRLANLIVGACCLPRLPYPPELKCFCVLKILEENPPGLMPSRLISKKS